ncbi:MAG: FAD synthase [Candidatus Iainarchaeum archaeon]|uniref:FAD synthase n=1 Tax=Candidatus Iainarchaeum sp. TaxID=3101447 RepID=A0A7T9DK84_9ARCH|nr:MAG: FAD synthase [Candidatus Diapherotrites archaeon]
MKTAQSTKKLVKKLHEHVRVVAFGTFDILHPGHLHYLTSAKKLGNELIVGIARDTTVQKLKGKLPANNEDTRLQMVAALRVVDKAVLGNKGPIYDILEEIKPGVIALGYDQHVDTEKLVRELEARKLKCKVIRLDAFSPEKFKSSRIKEKIRAQ